MAEDQVQRRLAAIMAADVVGYSRLMGKDEEGTLARLNALRTELLNPKVAEYRGRVVKTTGDGTLIEFPSAVDAVQSAVDIQQALERRNAGLPSGEKIEIRIGINLGDVIVEQGDIFGDGVNVAARLEAIAPPGGLCISDVVYQSVEGKHLAAFDNLGQRQVKNIEKPVHVWQWRPNQINTKDSPGADHQDIRFCQASDGAQIAYARVGTGPPLVKSPNWLNHLEYDWQSPIWRHLFRELALKHTMIRFDQRGNGLSDWDVDISFEAFVGDLETVVKAAGLERFSLLGISQGCASSIAYTVQNPDRVSKLVLYGGFARGSIKRGGDDRKKAEAMLTLIRQGWGQNNPAFRQMFTSAFVPDATPQQMEWFNELQRVSTSPENAVRIDEVNSQVDVMALLPKINVPTLVLHCREDGVVPFEEGRRIAAMIPDARFVPLEGRNHLILNNEPAWTRFSEEVGEFLS